MKHISLSKVAIFVVLIFVITSCTPGGEEFIEEPAGFFMGLWHGFILLFTFIWCLFA